MKNIETLIYKTQEQINSLANRLADYCEYGTYINDAIYEIVDNAVDDFLLIVIIFLRKQNILRQILFSLVCKDFQI